MKKELFGIIAFFALLLIIPVTSLCAGNDVVNNMPEGSVNWSKGIIQATGIGAPPEDLYGKPQARPMALRAAKLDAYRNLLETTKGLQLNSTTLVKDSVAQSDVIKTKVSGLIKGAQIMDKESISDGTVEVTVQMSLHGGFAKVILPSDESTTPTQKPSKGVFETAKKPSWASSSKPEKETSETQSPIYTGLIIDARGLNAKPAMAPKIVDKEGREVYGSSFVSRKFATQQGMSGYSKQLETAKTNDRVADNPLVVKGLNTQGPGRCNIVISNVDASMLRSASENLSFLKECKVMIVVD